MRIEQVISGLLKYLDREIFPSMNDWQAILGRVVVGRIANNADAIKNVLTTNAFFKTFAIIDENEHVDVEGVFRDIMTSMQSKPTIEISIPMFGTFKLNSEDIGKMKNYIMGAVI